MRVPSAERRVKKPGWLNDPIYYHNRGDTVFRGESAQIGDFVGLDDLFTEHPRVVQGMIDIYGAWIDQFGIDGFRVDTARHVNPEFWQVFVPAILARAKARGIPNFHIFGEVYTDAVDPAFTAVHTRRDGFPAVLDFAFAAAVKKVVAEAAPTSTLAGLFHVDPIYAGGEAAARQLPTFLGNHDMGRFARAIRAGHPKANDSEQLDRLLLGHAMLMTLRGVPTIYSGDEQGFAGDGNDQDAREDMFASKVAVYNDNTLVGTRATTATSNFDPAHPLYRGDRQSRRDPHLDPGVAPRRAEAPLCRGRAGAVRGVAIRPGERARGAAAVQQLDQGGDAECRGRGGQHALHRAGRAMRADRRRAGQRARNAGAARLCDLRRAMNIDVETKRMVTAAQGAPWWQGAGDLPDLSAQLCRFQR